jgi:hypothetical protein
MHGRAARKAAAIPHSQSCESNYRRQIDEPREDGLCGSTVVLFANVMALAVEDGRHGSPAGIRHLIED